MLKHILLTLTLLSAITMHSQDILGKWEGNLKISGQSLPLIFNISMSDDGKNYQATMDSPAQGARGIPVNSVSFENNELTLAVTAAKLTYHGTLTEANLIDGTFTQGNFSTSLPLSKVLVEKPGPNRPQEPKAPFPYISEDVTFGNQKANITLAGTLTVPSKDRQFPAVILISGSGPQNRDSEVLGHKPFLVLADYLTRNGIAVLRYDDRGINESTGKFKDATSFDFADDAASAVEFLKTRPEINPDQIGLIGHSEGGLIAPIVASNHQGIGFIILMAGPGEQGSQIMLKQKALIEAKMNIPKVAIDQNQEIFGGAYDLIINHKEGKLSEELANYFGEKYGKALPENQLNNLVGQLSDPWTVAFIKADPADYLPKVSCPVLAINGEKDLQIPPQENLTAIEKHLKSGGNKAVVMKEFKNLNHLFQECETGLPDEYAKIEQTIAPEVMETIGKWIKEQSK